MKAPPPRIRTSPPPELEIAPMSDRSGLAHAAAEVVVREAVVAAVR